MNDNDDRIVSQRPPPPRQPRRLGAITYRGEYVIEAWDSSCREERRWYVRRGDRYASAAGFDAASTALAMDCDSYDEAQQFVDTLVECGAVPPPVVALRPGWPHDPAVAASRLRAWADRVEVGTLSARFGQMCSSDGRTFWMVEFVVVPQPAKMAGESAGGPGPP
jgi:hypothetical protein